MKWENKRLWKSCRSWCDNQYIKANFYCSHFTTVGGAFLLSRLESKQGFDSMVFHSLWVLQKQTKPKECGASDLSNWIFTSRDLGLWNLDHCHLYYRLRKWFTKSEFQNLLHFTTKINVMKCITEISCWFWFHFGGLFNFGCLNKKVDYQQFFGWIGGVRSMSSQYK